MSMEFSDRVAIVTGGGSGIGLATARAIVAGGGRVVVADRDGDAAGRAARELGDAAVPVAADVSREADAEALAAGTVDRFGGLHVLVNSAGVVSKHRFLDLPANAFDAMIDVHVRGTFLVSQAAARRMAAGGAIVHLSSIAAELGNPLAVHYAAAKGAIRMLTRSMAVALARSGIRVNAVGPGTTDTPLTAGRLQDPDVRAAALQRVPLGRFGTPEEIADVVTFLASDRSRYVTGQTVYVDGGWTAQLYTADYEDLQYDRLPGGVP
jgi:NAD(P)-dependent dehydrogenase (short-subunit alcohol dehydrogenase family)